MKVWLSVRMACIATLAALLPASSLAQTDIILPRSPLADRIGAREVSFLASDLRTGARV